MKNEFRKGDIIVVIGTDEKMVVNYVDKCTYSLIPLNGNPRFNFTYNKLAVENSCVKVGRKTAND